MTEEQTDLEYQSQTKPKDHGGLGGSGRATRRRFGLGRRHQAGHRRHREVPGEHPPAGAGLRKTKNETFPAHPS